VRALLKVVSVLLLVLSLGLHWAVLQTVAWTGMLISYSQEGVREAIAKTFDGEHPCPLCKAVAKGRAEEQERDSKSVKPGGKLDPGLIPPGLEFAFEPTPRFDAIPACDTSAPERAEAPPKPRPRCSTV
jgi:hypothetical protein